MKDILRSTARIIFGRILPKRAYPVLQGPLKGAKFVLGALEGEGGGATVYFNMLEPEQTRAMTDALRSGMVLFDIGANVGFYTILGSRRVGPSGRVIAIEPLLRNLVYLDRHVRLNRADNVTVIPAACSDSVSLVSFVEGENNAMGYIGKEGTFGGNTALVPTVTVDAVAEKAGWSPDVIKIDVEGAELDVLRGAQKTLLEKKPQIFLSTHSDELRERCLAFLEECGYRYEVLDGDRDDPSSFLATRGT